MKKISKKIALSSASAVFLLSTISPAVIAFADSTTLSEKTNNDLDNKIQEKEFNSLYDALSPNKKEEFNSLIQFSELTLQEKIEILNYKFQSDSQPTARWKVALVRKALQYGGKLIGAKLGEKTISDMINYITNYQGKVETAISNAFVKYVHLNRGVANWVAKTVVFIVF